VRSFGQPGSDEFGEIGNRLEGERGRWIAREVKTCEGFEKGECPQSTDDFTVKVLGVFLRVRDISISYESE
jgi:hypothetical protein